MRECVERCLFKSEHFWWFLLGGDRMATAFVGRRNNVSVVAAGLRSTQIKIAHHKSPTIPSSRQFIVATRNWPLTAGRAVVGAGTNTRPQDRAAGLE